MSLSMFDFWIILTGALVASSGALLGSFLILRRLAMLGDAISHAILPGIVIAFLLTGSMESWLMFLGAVLVGILTTFIVQFLSGGGVHRDAAMGVTFTSLFALGVLGVSLFGSRVHLDLDCVLYGEIAYTPFDILLVDGKSWGPRPVWVNGAIFLLNLGVISLLYKEFKICSFDPTMAAAVGINMTLIHYILMALVALTTVGAFESVGVILIVAMLIVPAATAYLLTERLSRMLLLAVGIGVLCSFFGYYAASLLNCSIAGAMGTVAGIFFTLAFLFSPRHGVVSRWVHQTRLRYRVAEEDVLTWLARRREQQLPAGFTPEELSESQKWLMPETLSTINRLRRKGYLHLQNNEYALSSVGEEQVRQLLKRHRLYEHYLGELGYAVDHIHDMADRVEHHITPDIVEKIDEVSRHPDYDPQGKRIPR